MMYSPTIIEINGDFDRAMEFVRNLKDHNAITVVNSINKFRIEIMINLKCNLADAKVQVSVF